MMESVTCSVRYYRAVKFADVYNDVSVKTYYGKNVLFHGAGIDDGRPMTKLNEEELTSSKVWL